MTAAICWQSVCCNYWSNTNQKIFYWLLHFLTFFSCSGFTWGKKYIHYRRPNAVYNVITRWKSVISRKMTPIIICHQNDNHHDHHWDETLRTIPVASESIRFYISTYSARFTLLYNRLWNRWIVLQHFWPICRTRTEANFINSSYCTVVWIEYCRWRYKI